MHTNDRFLPDGTTYTYTYTDATLAFAPRASRPAVLLSSRSTVRGPPASEDPAPRIPIPGVTVDAHRLRLRRPPRGHQPPRRAPAESQSQMAEGRWAAPSSAANRRTARGPV